MKRATKAQQADLLRAVDWLIKHRDFSGLDMVIEDSLGFSDGQSTRPPLMPGRTIFRVFEALARIIPREQVEHMIEHAWDCVKTAVQCQQEQREHEAQQAAHRAQRTKQAAELLGVDVGELEAFVEKHAK